jgi:hypothetical protein
MKEIVLNHDFLYNIKILHIFIPLSKIHQPKTSKQ